MRCVVAIRLIAKTAMATALLVAALAVAPASAATPVRPADLQNRDAILRWINDYRSRPDIDAVPALVQRASRLGLFHDQESSGVFVGFLAGVIGCHPARAEGLINKMLPLPAEDQWVIVKAIAYSGLPNWKELLRKVADKLSARRLMVDRYLTGRLPPLNAMALEKTETGSWEKIKGYVHAPTPDGTNALWPTFDSNPDLLDTLWGYYFATGAQSSVNRIIIMLPWSKDRNNVERLTIGNMAKYTLATNAARDADLLALLERSAKTQPAQVKPILDEVIEAAETVDTQRIRKEALFAIDELKRRGPGYKRDVSAWGQIGEGAISLGCIAAAALGQIEFGLPCVLGGALSSAAMRYWSSQ